MDVDELRAVLDELKGGILQRYWGDTVEIDEPRTDEILVRIVATGLCHTDLFTKSVLPERLGPCVFGHEGAGVVEAVGSSMDNVQWESILRSVSAHRAYGWVYDAELRPANIADFLISNGRMPRSLAFCYRNWRVASTIIGVRTEEQLDQCLDAWSVTLSPEVLEAIDAIRYDETYWANIRRFTTGITEIDGPEMQSIEDICRGWL